MREDPKFGTDGVRGLANADLSAYYAFRLGRTAGALLRSGERPLIVVGQDTRISSDMLRCALVSGFLSSGADVLDAGVLPTAGVSYLTETSGAVAGAMISASHNPAPDNGIKFFGPDGSKISDEVETEMEERVDRFDAFPAPTGADVGRLYPGTEHIEKYLDHLRAAVPERLEWLRVVMDCANGAAYRFAPHLLRRLGAEVILMGAEPDGMNINTGCGALYPQRMAAAVVEHQAHLGVSFDGDADRAILADEKGRLVDGDRVMGICALQWKDTDNLPGNQVVGTVMSNLGLERGLAQHGIRLRRAPVGDRHVAEMMRAEGAALGGEKSGHIIFSRHATTGDGPLTLLQVASVVRQSGQPLSVLADQIREYPQVLINVPVRLRRNWRNHQGLRELVQRLETDLAGAARFVVRRSGTERLMRVMAEGEDAAQVQAAVDEIVAYVKEQESEWAEADATGGLDH